MLVAPFPYFGGKSSIADMVWRRIGDVDRWIEPFFGSGAVTLARPSWHRKKVEIVNDIDAYVANFWRAVSAAPDEVAEYCSWPINECDLEARHKWLVESARKREHMERMRDDPDYYDPRIAGWWCWGLAQWIGSGWCDGEWHGRGNKNSRGTGTHGGRCGKLPRLAHVQGVHRCFFDIGDNVSGECDRRLEIIRMWFRTLQDRLRNVIVTCGDWRRSCDSDTALFHNSNTCGVFLDPPYSAEAGREMKLYRHDSATVAHEVREWCLRRGSDRRIRIALCGYAGEGHEELERHGWSVVSWTAHGGYAYLHNGSSRGRSNRSRERVWFSPHCINEESLFHPEPDA